MRHYFVTDEALNLSEVTLFDHTQSSSFSRVVSVSNEGNSGALRFWSSSSRSFIASVRLEKHDVDHLIFNGRSVLMAYTSDDIEIWSASEYSLLHRYPNQEKLYSIVFDEV